MLPESTVGIPWSSKKHPLHKIIAPMDIYPYKKKHLYTSNLWNIILNQLSIKILTLNIRWHYLDKNHIDLWLLSMYIQMQKNKWQLNGLRYKSITWLAPRVEINRFLSLIIFLQLQCCFVFMYIFGSPPVFEIGKFHISLPMPI